MAFEEIKNWVIEGATEALKTDFNEDEEPTLEDVESYIDDALNEILDDIQQYIEVYRKSIEDKVAENMGL